MPIKSFVTTSINKGKHDIFFRMFFQFMRGFLTAYYCLFEKFKNENTFKFIYVHS